MLRMLPAAAAFLLLVAGARAQDQAGVEFFETRVRPLLAANCYRCHGPEKQRSGMRLDRHGSILAGGERGPAVVPGDPDASHLIQAVRYLDEDLQMPPKNRLAPDEIALLEEWVAMGAPGPEEAAPAAAGPASDGFDLEERRKHWAWQPNARPQPPPVNDPSWPLTTADRFILAGLERAGLAPAPDCGRRAWIRRATFDVTGLPPTPEEVAAFLADDSPDAYEKVADRLLASPGFGERWARHWLDLVRYAETRGHEYDFAEPNAFQYRDYLIRAFNADVPYDDFLVEHVAGDLLPEPRLSPEGWNESVLGTGFWFLGEEVHSPVDTRLDETDRTANKLDVFGKAFLGLTVACARCHDHKFDAISSRDYYALSGYLVSSSYRQVRFQSMVQNAEAARILEQARAEAGPRFAESSGAALERDLRDLERFLVAAGEVLDAGPQEGGRVQDLPGDFDLLFEDFEGEDYGAWNAEGTAFGDRPRRLGDMAPWQGELAARGQGLVNSHQTRNGEDTEAADAHTGRLTSPAFRIDRDYIHFLVGGGAHEDKTCVVLLVDGEVVRSATGHNANRLEPARWEVSGLRGKRARIQVVDAEPGGWGNVGLDQVVFSNRPEATVLEAPWHPQEAADWYRRAKTVARRTLVPAPTLWRWVEALRRAPPGSADDLPGIWSLGRRDPSDLAARAAEWQDRKDRSALWLSEAEVVWDASAAGPGGWIVNGPAFGSGPVETGAPRFGSGPRPGVHARPAAWKDPFWDALVLAPETEPDSSEVSWTQAGRTLRTPTFVMGGGQLYYLVKGAGHAFACVDQHRMIHGPLHLQTTLDLETGGRWRWVRHDLSDYAGRRVHVEFSPRDPADGRAPDFSLAMVVRATRPLEAGPDPDPEPISLLADDPPGAGRLADRLQDLCVEAVRRFRTGRLADGQRDRALAALVDWMLGHQELFPRLVDSEDLGQGLSQLSEEQDQIRRDRVRPVSATAPALLDGNGMDEFLLVRGSHKSPAGAVPRRFLEALGGVRPPAHVTGSGRLELARSLVHPSNPLPARVMANRVWHHLFGRGIVATVDDFGIQGKAPTHPELLDWLAARFVEQGWSVKALVKELLLSRTYRMASTGDPAAGEQDPENRLWHRAFVRRLTAEAIRDAILATSGRLDPKMYGPPVAIHLTEFMEGRGRPGRSGPLDGEGRRSIYLSVRRNFLVPFFTAFDFPTPATTAGRRTTSNVPAQALALMNDPFVLGQAGLWAEGALEREDLGEEERVSFLYLTAFARPPTTEEARKAATFLEVQRRFHGGDQAERLAWADLCHVLYNVKEFIFLP